MLQCVHCRNPLIEGQILCPACGYDQRKSVGRGEISTGIRILITVLWMLLLPAAGVAFLAACAGTGLTLDSYKWPHDLTIFCAIVAGIVAALALLLGGGYLIFWLKHR